MWEKWDELVVVGGMLIKPLENNKQNKATFSINYIRMCLARAVLSVLFSIEDLCSANLFVRCCIVCLIYFLLQFLDLFGI